MKSYIVYYGESKDSTFRKYNVFTDFNLAADVCEHLESIGYYTDIDVTETKSALND